MRHSCVQEIAVVMGSVLKVCVLAMQLLLVMIAANLIVQLILLALTVVDMVFVK